MKIGCIGIGGTGKTKFAKKLAKKLDLPFLPSVTRSVYERSGLTEADISGMDDNARAVLQMSIFKARQEAEALHPDYVSDRTMLDHLAYYLYSCQVQEEEYHLRLEELKKNLSQYDYLFFFPRESGWWPKDNFRSQSFSQVYVLEMIMNNLIESSNSEAVVYDMISGSVKDRVKWARGTIE